MDSAAKPEILTGFGKVGKCFLGNLVLILILEVFHTKARESRQNPILILHFHTSFCQRAWRQCLSASKGHRNCPPGFPGTQKETEIKEAYNVLYVYSPLF